MKIKFARILSLPSLLFCTLLPSAYGAQTLTKVIMTTGSFSGSARLMFNDGKTTSVPQVLSVVRTNVTRAGTPARSVTLEGSYPCSFTTTFAV